MRPVVLSGHNSAAVINSTVHCGQSSLTSGQRQLFIRSSPGGIQLNNTRVPLRQADNKLKFTTSFLQRKIGVRNTLLFQSKRLRIREKVMPFLNHLMIKRDTGGE